MSKSLPPLSGSTLNTRENYELFSLMMMVSPSKFLSQIKPDILDKYIKSAIEEQKIDLRYDYGVYNVNTSSFFILNGNYVADIGATNQSSELASDLNLYNSPHVINFSLNEEDVAAKLVLYFPQRKASFWRSAIPNLATSLVFTSLILFCFMYTIYVILRQKKVSEMKNDFINNMTHEFKTPIATISLASDSIPMVIKDEEKVKRFVNIIKQENQRMLSQVEKVLDISKAEKQSFKLNIIDLDINEVVNQACSNFSLIIQNRNGSMMQNLLAKKPIIQGDQTHVSNVIHNLIDNAVKYSQNAPEIEVTTKDAKNGVEIEVKDNGIGMSKDSLKYIFDKFYRVHTGNLHDVKGFGLGLSYVKSMVDKHNGTVSVKSELNKGSTFTVYLPARQEI